MHTIILCSYRVYFIAISLAFLLTFQEMVDILQFLKGEVIALHELKSDREIIRDLGLSYATVFPDQIFWYAHAKRLFHPSKVKY